jgi:hypothetical protein
MTVHALLDDSVQSPLRFAKDFIEPNLSMVEFLGSGPKSPKKIRYHQEKFTLNMGDHHAVVSLPLSHLACVTLTDRPEQAIR